MPNAVCSLLLDSGVKDLGIHTEMLTDGIIDLYKAGLIKGDRKKLDPGKVTYSFALGSRALYDCLDHNPDMHCCPVDHTNLPHMIMQNDNVISINNTTQIDLQGQAASRIGRPPSHQRHGRAIAVRARRLCVKGRKIVHLPRVHL